jgi:hypothetical protein
MIGIVDGCQPSVAERAPCVLEDLSAATHCRGRLGVPQDLDVAYIESSLGPARRPASTRPPRFPVIPRPSAAHCLPSPALERWR